MRRATGRLAADDVPLPRWRALLRRHLLAADGALGPPFVPTDPAGGRRRWRTKRDKILEQGRRCSRIWPSRRARPGGEIGPDVLTRVGESLLRLIDPVNGGIGRAPKFPNAPIFRFLDEFFRRRDPRMREAVRALLDALCAGGIYDHLGGGFARYSTDAEWHVPHFEKMLYDNAQILELLALAHAETPSPIYEARARETFGWLMREMRVGDAFASSQDADQDGEEGLFYVWTADEIDALLGADSAAFKAAYDVRREGNWEGRNVLRRVTPAGRCGRGTRLRDARARLFAARETRPRPPLDDKVLADWNGLMIAALARAAAVFDAPEFLEAARAAFAFVWSRLRDARGRLAHSWRADRVGASGMLDDYAALARAALALFEATGEPPISTPRPRLPARRGPVRRARRRPLPHRRGRERRPRDPPPHRPRRRDAQRRRPDRRSFRAALSPDRRSGLARIRRAPDPRLRGRRAARARAEPAAARERRHAGARRLRRRRRPAGGPAGSGTGPGRASRPRPRADGAAPRPRPLALRRARRPARAAEPPAAMLCRGQTCGLPARTVEGLREELGRLNSATARK